MEKWTANFINDPHNDYNLIIEVNYDGNDVAIIKMEQHGLELHLYAHNKDLKIPADWLLKLLLQANKSLIHK